MNKAIDTVHARKRHIWLGVSERNDKAILFYKKVGFMKSAHSFFIGRKE